MRLVDTHCHLDFDVFDADRDAVLARCRAAGVSDLVVPGVAAAAWDAQQALCDATPGLHAAYGLHPLFLDRHAAGDPGRLERRLAEAPAVAVGEIGLDRMAPDPRGQLRLFEAQLAVARDAGLPVLLHVRRMHDETLAALRRTPVAGGIVHAFNGSPQQAAGYLALGFGFGLGGMLTFGRSRHLRMLAASLPAESLLLETDAPDMTVASHRGERNSPEYLPEVLAALSEVRSETSSSLAAQTTANALRHLPRMA